MTASDNLSPHQFPGGALYHGTSHELEGSTLRPGKKWSHYGDINAYPRWGEHSQSTKDVVSASEEESTAWNFALMNSAESKGRPVVHEVKPNENMRMGIEHADHPRHIQSFENKEWRNPENNQEWISDHFDVVGTHYGPPGSQPAISGHNWHDLGGNIDYSRASGHGPLGYGPRGNETAAPFHYRPNRRPLKQRRLGEDMARDASDALAKGQGTLF